MNRLLFLILCGFSFVMSTNVNATVQGDTLLIKQAREAAKAENYSKALELFLMADKTFVPDTTDYYGNVQHNIGYVYYMLGDMKNAAVYWERALKVFPQFSEKNEKLLDLLGGIYYDLGDQNNLMRILELINQHNEHELTKPCTSLKDYFERAKYFGTKGETVKAKEHYLKALELVEAATPAEKEDVYSSYAYFLSSKGDRTEAVNYYIRSADIHKQIKGEDHQWGLMVYMLAINRQLLQIWSDSYDSYNTAYKCFERLADENYMAKCLHGMGNCLYFQKKFNEAKDCYSRELAVLGKEASSADYAKALEYIAKTDVQLKNYDAAIDNLNKAAGIYENINDYANLQSALTALNSVYVKSGNGYNEEIAARSENAAKKKSLEILEDEKKSLPAYLLQFGDDGIQYAQSLGMVAELTYKLVDKNEGVSAYRKYLETERKALRRVFVLQNEKERQYTWYSGSMFRDSMMAAVCDVNVINKQQGDSINALAYDLQLLSKGILLNSAIEFSRVLEESGDMELIADYETIKQLDAKIQNLQKDNATGKNSSEISRLRQEYDRLMLTLMQRCRELKDFTEYLDYKWADVRNALDEDDVAIEFAEIKNGVLDTENIIVALMVSKQSSAPVAIPICSRGQAAIMASDTLAYANNEYGALIWDNIFAIVGSCKRLFFSADVELSGLGIEYMLYKGKPVIDHCDVYRLSSTKELCRQKINISFKEVALFGGIDYGHTDNMKTISWRRVNSDGKETEELSGIINYSPLKGTGKEVENIGKILKSIKGCSVNLYEGTKASEQTIRSLSGNNNLNVIHVATHGQYIGEDKATEAEAMDCSLLAFSGANFTINEIENDGILTAKDVAEMNFRNCRLAVLSACETGLGKLAGDGVFGLQRGFKNAGVHTLLMSLCKVNDAATTELMIQFYKALVANFSPNAALRRAQQYMRANGYDNPRLWASFIILDGQ